MADAKGLLLWPVRPKHHWLWHLGQRASFLSPRKAACFLDEDFMGKVKKVMQRCTASLALHKVPGKFLQKYRWGRYVRKMSLKRA